MAELQREEIVARIKQARKESGLTQEELADLLDVIPRTYQNYESTRVPWGFINQIAKATGKTPEWLLHGDPKPTPDLMGSLSGNRAQLDRIETMLRDIAAALNVPVAPLDPVVEEMAQELGDDGQPSEQPDDEADEEQPPQTGTDPES